MVKLVGMLLMLSLTAAAPVRAVDKPMMEGPQTDIDAIVAVFGEWGKARDAGDIDGIVAVHHPDMKIITRNKALYAGHVGVRRFYSDHYDQDSKRQLFSNVEEIRVFGQVAFVIGRFLAPMPPRTLRILATTSSYCAGMTPASG